MVYQRTPQPAFARRREGRVGVTSAQCQRVAQSRNRYRQPAIIGFAALNPSCGTPPFSGWSRAPVRLARKALLTTVPELRLTAALAIVTFKKQAVPDGGAAPWIASESVDMQPDGF
jgi:hypothetical protein